MNFSDKKILFGYLRSEGYNNRHDITKKLLQYIDRLNSAGFRVKPFCMNYSDLLPNIIFRDLDRLWKLRDKKLMLLYDNFLKEVEGCDIFFNSVGVNFHPEFIDKVRAFTVYCCNDDPEASNNLSKPTAFSYDMCAVGNIAEFNAYKSWGCKNVDWQPMGITDLRYDPNLTYEQILASNRDIDLFMMIDRLRPERKNRCDQISAAFPDGHFYGRGWERGYLPEGQSEVDFLQRSKIGINMHLSTGPINVRLFYLPANGVLQICDNKENLSKIFELDKEVVGFDTIDECIDKCHYYLTHKEEARYIAAEGWKRVHKDYNEIAVFERLVNNISKYYTTKKECADIEGVFLEKKRCSKKIYSFVYRNYIAFRMIIIKACLSGADWWQMVKKLLDKFKMVYCSNNDDRF
jgi:hypothetical protein